MNGDSASVSRQNSRVLKRQRIALSMRLNEVAGSRPPSGRASGPAPVQAPARKMRDQAPAAVDRPSPGQSAMALAFAKLRK